MPASETLHSAVATPAGGVDVGTSLAEAALGADKAALGLASSVRECELSNSEAIRVVIEVLIRVDRHLLGCSAVADLASRLVNVVVRVGEVLVFLELHSEPEVEDSIGLTWAVNLEAALEALHLPVVGLNVAIEAVFNTVNLLHGLHLVESLVEFLHPLLLFYGLGIDGLGVDRLGVDGLGVDGLGIDGLGIDGLRINWLGVNGLRSVASGRNNRKSSACEAISVSDSHRTSFAPDSDGEIPGLLTIVPVHSSEEINGLTSCNLVGFVSRLAIIETFVAELVGFGHVPGVIAYAAARHRASVPSVDLDVDSLSNIRGDLEVVTRNIASCVGIVASSGHIIIEHEEGRKAPAFNVVTDGGPVEALHSILDGHVEEAVLFVLDKVDLFSELISPRITFIRPGTMIALSTPRVAHLNESHSIGEHLDTNNSVLVAVRKAVCVLDIVVTLTGSACKDEISLLVSFFDCVPDGINIIACVVEVKVGSASHSTNSHLSKAAFCTKIVTPVLGESFLEESTPE